MELLITAQIDGEDVPAGRLFQNVRHGSETASFSYLDSYLSDRRAPLFQSVKPFRTQHKISPPAIRHAILERTEARKAFRVE